MKIIDITSIVLHIRDPAERFEKLLVTLCNESECGYTQCHECAFHRATSGATTPPLQVTDEHAWDRIIAQAEQYDLVLEK